MDPMALQPYEIGCLREREREKKKGERDRERERETETESERARERERERQRGSAIRPVCISMSEWTGLLHLGTDKKNSSLAFNSKSMILIGLRTCRLLCMLYVS